MLSNFGAALVQVYETSSFLGRVCRLFQRNDNSLRFILVELLTGEHFGISSIYVW